MAETWSDTVRRLVDMDMLEAGNRAMRAIIERDTKWRHEDYKKWEQWKVDHPNGTIVFERLSLDEQGEP